MARPDADPRRGQTDRRDGDDRSEGPTRDRRRPQRGPDTGGRGERAPQGPRWSWGLVLVYAAAALLLVWAWQQTFESFQYTEIPYSRFEEHLGRGEAADLKIGPDEIRGRILAPPPSGAGPAGEPDGGAGDEAGEPEAAGEGAGPEGFLFRTVRVEDPDLIARLEEQGVEFQGTRPGLLSQMLPWLIPIGVLVVIWVLLFRRFAQGAGQGALSFGKSRARIVPERGTGVRFEDVAGYEEAKRDLQEVVDFLRSPERYSALGARIPKGVLLVGPPGTGKTLVARAVAGEAGVPFFSISGSEFVEMFVGVGAARVRDLFEQAKRQAPCIVFLDELDAIGRHRAVSMGPTHEEREQTLNQLLVEMDGFEANAGIITLSATNRPELLDRALLRPGRFDRQVLFDAPDLQARAAILKVHARGKPLGGDVDLQRVAQSTPGFSGADLANVLNEAALLAARSRSREIRQLHVEEAVERVIAGPERKSRRLVEDEKRRVAYHETGHAVVAAHCELADPVHKISIVPRGRAALGHTMQLPAGERFLIRQAELLDKVRGLLGGRAAEELVFGEVSTGSENDLDQATRLVRQMVTVYGMGRSVRLARCARREGPEYLTEAGELRRDCSEETAREIDREVIETLDAAYAEAKGILEKHRDELERVAQELVARETLTGDELRALLGSGTTGGAGRAEAAAAR